MTPALVYLGTVVAALALLAVFPVDHDPGPPPGERYPRWDSWSKWHIIGSAAMALVAVYHGVPVLPAIGVTLFAGIGWEIVNGYFDPWDVFWDLAGAIVGALVGGLLP